MALAAGRALETGAGVRPNLILACGALAKEVIALRDQLGSGAELLKLQCLPAELHNRPAEIAPRVDAYLTEHRGEYDRVLVGYGDCGTCGALDKVLEKHDAQRLPHAHCYEFFATSRLFSDITEAEIGSFFVTDYLVKHFDRLVIEGLGLDRLPHLRDIYFGNYRDLVYLAQTDAPLLQIKARDAAEKLKLNYVYRSVGYGDLAEAVADVALV
ncbi:DUF1638 domain-containing protein [Altererythrobacter sp.]|uniref:DUF1638 domain-containing protein n=1 Tax=Altererythrobacter sp. TaxID=1872480 RepID=UPI003D054AA4